MTWPDCSELARGNPGAMLPEAMFRDVLDSRLLRWLAICWVVGFLVVIVPGHRRGVVQLPGHDAVVTTAKGVVTPFCPLCTLMPAGGNSKDRPPTDSPINCAICFLKVGLDLPPTVIAAPQFIDDIEFLMGRINIVEPPHILSQVTLHGRAPPVA